MNNDKFYIDPLLPLYIQRSRAKVTHSGARLRTAKDLHRQLRKIRQDFMGSYLSLNKLTQVNGQPSEYVVGILSEYLGEVTERFLNEYHNDTNDDNFCYNFYYYCLQIFSHNKTSGRVDDLLELANAYEISSNIMHIILTENLPTELAEEAGQWVMEHDAAPKEFGKCVTAGLAVLLGVMPEPNIKEEE